MAAPTIATVSSNKTGTGSTDILVTYATDGPSGLATNDLLIAFFSINGEGTTPVMNAPSSSTAWNLVGSDVRTAGLARIGYAAYWQLYAGDATVSLTCTPNAITAGMTAKVIRITGHDLVTPINASLVTTDASTDPFPIGGVTTTVNDCLIIYGIGGATSVVGTWTFSVGAEQWDFGTDPGGANEQAASTKTQASAGATGDESADSSAAPFSVGICIAVAPAAASAKHSKLPILGVG